MTSAPHGWRKSDARSPRWRADLQELLDARNALEPEQFLERPLPVPGSATLAGQTLGAYTLVSPIGQGGMGSVWLARRSDGRFEGVAAVKLLNASLVGRAGEERFRREGSILARLAIPTSRTSSTRECRRAASRTSCSSWSRASRSTGYCESRDLGVEKRLGLFLDVLEAVAHAHANLIVHRDIKPSNVLVANDGRGEAPRLRHREASRGGIRHRRSDSADARRRPRAHARVRRAGAGHRRHGDDRDRRLRPRRAALRASHGKTSGGGVAAIARRPPAIDRRNGADNVPPTPRRPTLSAGSSGAIWTRSWPRR